MSALMRPVTAIETAARAAQAWRRQYADWSPDDHFADGTTKGEVDAALNSQQHTPENIAQIINAGWAYPKCDCCGEMRRVLVEMKEDWSDDSASLCLECLQRAVHIASQFPEALQPVDGSKTSL